MTIPDKKTIRILFIDDDSELADHLRTILINHGIELEHAIDGTTGLSRLKEEAFDVVLVDYYLPDIDGLHILKNIMDAEVAMPPSIMVSGTSAIATAVQSFRLGASEFVMKKDHNALFKVLPTVIHQVVDQHRNTAQEQFNHQRRKIQRRILQQVVEVQSQFISETPESILFDKLLTGVMHVTDSPYGFMASLEEDNDGKSYLRPLSINIPDSDVQAHNWCAQHEDSDIQFHNLNLLFGEPIKHRSNIISNDPSKHPAWMSGPPEGHPPIHSFAGLPLWQGDLITGVIGLSNRDGGYEPWLLDELAPLLATCAQLLESSRLEQKRQRAWQQLVKSRHFFETILEDLPILICRWKTDGTITYVNELYCDFFGKTRQKLIGSSFIPMITEDDRKGMQQHIDSLIHSADTEFNEHRVTNHAGKICWQKWLNRALKDENGQVSEIQSIGMDITEEYQRKQELKMTRHALEISREATFWIDKESRLYEVNRAACDSLGYNRSELIKMHVYDIDPLFPKERWPAHWLEVIDKGHMCFESFHLRKDGSTFPVEITVNHFEFNGENYIFAHAIDITRRKASKKREEEAVDAWERTFDAISDPIMILDTGYKIIRANHAMTQLLDLSTESIISQTCFTLMHGTTKPVESCPHKQLLQDGKCHTVEIHEEKLNGDFLISVSPLHDANGQLAGSIHISRDVTKQKRMEDALKASEAHFRQFFESAPLAYQALNNTGHLISMNQAWRDLTGYKIKPALGKWFGTLLIESDRKRFTAFLNKLLQDEMPKPFECRMMTARKEMVQISIQVRTIHDTQGQPAKIHCILVDLTAQKKREDENRKAAYQAGLAEMGATVLHNIGNAIMSIQHQASVMEQAATQVQNIADQLRQVPMVVTKQLNTGGKADEILDVLMSVISDTSDQLDQISGGRVLHNAQTINAAVDHIAEIIRIQQSAARPIEMAHDFSLEEILNETLAIFGDGMKRRDIIINRVEEAGPFMLHLPHGQLLQSLINLVKNSVEAIATRRESETIKGKIHISALRPKSGWVELHVEDNGCGIPKEDIDQIFRHGFTTKKSGVGFGLHSTALFIQSIGGTIQAVSKGINQGTEFILNMPLHLKGTRS
ncbi:MAG: PAS domain S-box protein [Magnetococcales bacterium]|nr:PAS domain S-box protein [Magnetococcales bacterium]